MGSHPNRKGSKSLCTPALMILDYKSNALLMQAGNINWPRTDLNVHVPNMEWRKAK